MEKVIKDALWASSQPLDIEVGIRKSLARSQLPSICFRKLCALCSYTFPATGFSKASVPSDGL